MPTSAAIQSGRRAQPRNSLRVWTSEGAETLTTGNRSGRIRVLHVINSFQHGGAETMLCNLVLRTDLRRFEPSVVSLIDDLTVAGPLLRAGIGVTTMGMRPGVPDPRGVANLAQHLRKVRPHVVQSWMDHSNLLTSLAARISSQARVVWGVHHSHHVPGIAKRSTLWAVAACAAISHYIPDRIVFCSEHGRRLYREQGFAEGGMTVIPNGFDTGRFKPDRAARAQIRSEIGIGDDVPLVGLVARFDPLKDHATFLRAAALLLRDHRDAHFLLCGQQVDGNNAALASQVAALGLAQRCHLLGPRSDAAKIHTSLDVLSSSSISEAFPLVVGEAMASGVPCAVTNVGDSALLVGPTGKVVPPANPEAMAAAWTELLAMPPDQRNALGLAARARVCERFSLASVAQRYEALYEQLARQPRKSPGRRREGAAGSLVGTEYVQPT